MSKRMFLMVILLLLSKLGYVQNVHLDSLLKDLKTKDIPKWSLDKFESDQKMWEKGNNECKHRGYLFEQSRIDSIVEFVYQRQYFKYYNAVKFCIKLDTVKIRVYYRKIYSIEPEYIDYSHQVFLHEYDPYLPDLISNCQQYYIISGHEKNCDTLSVISKSLAEVFGHGGLFIRCLRYNKYDYYNFEKNLNYEVRYISKGNSEPGYYNFILNGLKKQSFMEITYEFFSFDLRPVNHIVSFVYYTKDYEQHYHYIGEKFILTKEGNNLGKYYLK